jgi:hypothetical protein
LRHWSERQAEIADLANRQLFFVGGAPRSGTTWVQHILDGHPDISCRGEGHFLHFLAAPMGAMMQRRREELEAKNTRLFKDTGGYPLPAADDFEFLVGSAILLALQQQCAGRSCLAIGEKTPENVFYFPNLKRLFPGAKFIGVARDPRDVLTSAWHLVHKPAVQEEEEAAKTVFVRRAVASVGEFLRAMLDIRQRYPNDVTIVTYEDLQRSPTPIVAGAFRFLGVTDAPDIVARCIGQSSFTAMSGGRPPGVERSGAFFRKGIAGDWVSMLTPEMNDFVLQELGWMFPHFGWKA